MSNPHASYDSTAAYPRDLVGYGRHTPHAQWPNQARIAVQFVLNYEEGGENATLHGDAVSAPMVGFRTRARACPAGRGELHTL